MATKEEKENAEVRKQLIALCESHCKCDWIVTIGKYSDLQVLVRRLGTIDNQLTRISLSYAFLEKINQIKPISYVDLIYTDTEEVSQWEINFKKS